MCGDDMTKVESANAGGERILDVQLDPGAQMPTIAHDSDSGYDLRSLETVDLYPGQHRRIRTGVHLGLYKFVREDARLEAIIRPRSSMTNAGIITGIGTIDNGYTGAIDVSMYNATDDVVHIEKGHRIAQFVLHWVPIVKELQQVCELHKTDRGDNGFGSSGKA